MWYIERQSILNDFYIRNPNKWIFDMLMYFQSSSRIIFHKSFQGYNKFWEELTI
jgi:hypothetical protein